MDEERQALIDQLMLAMIANTDCSWIVATAAIAFWQFHYQNNTAPVYGLVDSNDEHSNVVYEQGDIPRSLKIGVQCERDTIWYMTLQS